MEQDPSHPDTSGDSPPAPSASAHQHQPANSFRKPFHNSKPGFSSNKSKSFTQHSHTHFYAASATKSYSSVMTSHPTSSSTATYSQHYSSTSSKQPSYHHGSRSFNAYSNNSPMNGNGGASSSNSNNSNATHHPMGKKPNVPQLRIGNWASVTLLNGTVVKGQLYSIDFESSVLVLMQKTATDLSPNNPQFNVTAVPFGAMVAIEKVIGEKDQSLPALMPLTIDQMVKKEEAAVREAAAAAARFGVGVSAEAQDIFDALSKTLPCRWSETSIIVMDDVVIDSPYEMNNCSGEHAHTLARVKKVLELERKRLELS